MKAAALVAVALIAIVVVCAVFAIRGLRKFVRALWPHS